MNHIQNLGDITDLRSVAVDLADLLSQANNADVADEFPSSVARYTGDIDKVASNLLEIQGECAPGVRQQFVAFTGERAVGMSVVRFADEVPEGVDAAWPNVSGFVCNPFRNQGIGRLALVTRVAVVQEQFGGSAWTRVRRPNLYSQRMVRHAGFSHIGEDAEGLLYVYHSKKIDKQMCIK